MKMRCVLMAAGLCLVQHSAFSIQHSAWALDTVKKTSGTVIGEVRSVGKYQVDVVRSGLTQKVNVNEIVTIYFDDDPNSMSAARNHIIDGRYRDALEMLGKVSLANVDRAEMIQQDLDYYQALCAARLALGGTGTIRDAGSKMAKFVTAHPDSYHFLEACEVVGDLLVAMGLYANAEKYYAQVGAAPWPDYRMRANVAIGRAQLAQGKTAEARQSFQAVLDTVATGELANAQKLAATLGMARCSEDPGEAIATVKGILAKADPENVELHARAYNTLGTAYRKANQPKEALLAFLHVDVLYFAVPEAHAEALANLAELWDEFQKTERVVRARAILEEQYGNSPWAKKGSK